MTPRARIAGQTVVGRRPRDHAHGSDPRDGDGCCSGPASRIDDIDLFEINEAFAPVVLAWAQEHHPDMDRVNVNGGAIALGHPLGASGARLMTTMLHELERRDARYGLAGDVLRRRPRHRHADRPIHLRMPRLQPARVPGLLTRVTGWSRLPEMAEIAVLYSASPQHDAQRRVPP